MRGFTRAIARCRALCVCTHGAAHGFPKAPEKINVALFSMAYSTRSTIGCAFYIEVLSYASPANSLARNKPGAEVNLSRNTPQFAGTEMRWKTRYWLARFCARGTHRWRRAIVSCIEILARERAHLQRRNRTVVPRARTELRMNHSVAACARCTASYVRARRTSVYGVKTTSGFLLIFDK